MKTAFKWIGGAVLALIAIVWYFNMEKSEQRWLGLLVMFTWFVWFAGIEWDKAQKRAIATYEAVRRIEARLDAVAKEVYDIENAVALIRHDSRG
jgi:hypothetical protein